MKNEFLKTETGKLLSTKDIKEVNKNARKLHDIYCSILDEELKWLMNNDYPTFKEARQAIERQRIYIELRHNVFNFIYCERRGKRLKRNLIKAMENAQKEGVKIY